MAKWKALLTAIGISTAIIFFTAGASSSHDPVFPAEKLKTLFPLALSFEQKNLYISDEQRAMIEGQLKSRLPEEDLRPSIYLAIVKDHPDSPPQKAAAIIFIDARGEGGKIEIGIVVSGRGKLIRVHVFENKEPEKLSRSDFLRQFEGKKASDMFQVGSDIQAPAGTEGSAQAIASGARRGLLIIEELFRKR